MQLLVRHMAIWCAELFNKSVTSVGNNATGRWTVFLGHKFLHSQEQFYFFCKCKQSSSIIAASELKTNIFLWNCLWRKLWFIQSPNWHTHMHREKERVCTKPSCSVDLSENQQNHDCFRFSAVASAATKRILFAHYSTIAAEFCFVNSSTSRLLCRTRISCVNKSHALANEWNFCSCRENSSWLGLALPKKFEKRFFFKM